MKQLILAPNHHLLLTDSNFKLVEGPVFVIQCYFYSQPAYYSILDSILVKSLKLYQANLTKLNLYLYEVSKEYLLQLEKEFKEKDITVIYLYLPVDKYSEIPLLNFVPWKNG